MTTAQTIQAAKKRLLTVKNFNLFNNDKPQVTFTLGYNKDTKEFNKVQADFGGYDKDNDLSIRGLNAKSKSSGNSYVRLNLEFGVDGVRAYAHGIFYHNRHKKVGSNQPDFLGVINLDNNDDGEKLEVALWKKTAKSGSGEYLYAVMSQQAAPVGESKAQPASADQSQHDAAEPDQAAIDAANSAAAAAADADKIPF